MKNPHAKLVKIDRHPSLFRNPVSQKIYFRGTVNGSQYKFSTGVTSLAEANKIIDLKKAEIYNGKSASTKRRKKGNINPSMEDLFKEFFEIRSPKWSKSTQTKYMVAWNHGLKEFWAGLHLNDIKTKQAASDKAVEFENWYLRNKPGRAFFNTRKLLLALMRYLEEKDLINRAPKIERLDKTINAKIKRKQVGRVFSEEETASLFKHAVNLRTSVAIMIYRTMGVRKMELLTSKKESWDLENRIASIWSFKKKKWRKIPIPKKVMDPLREWMASTQSEYLFPNPKDLKRHMSGQTIDRNWRETKRAAGVKDSGALDARIHDLRHSKASDTVTEGWNPIVACEILDMSLKIYQQVYAHVSEEDKRRAMDKKPKAPPTEGCD